MRFALSDNHRITPLPLPPAPPQLLLGCKKLKYRLIHHHQYPRANSHHKNGVIKNTQTNASTKKLAHPKYCRQQCTCWEKCTTQTNNLKITPTRQDHSSNKQITSLSKVLLSAHNHIISKRPYHILP